MSNFTKHILIPALAPTAIVALYLTPVSLVGCVNRGIMALAVVFVSLAAGIVTGMHGLRGKRKGDQASNWWIASAIIFGLPVLLVLGPRG